MEAQKRQLVVGVDIGGTKIRLCIARTEGNILYRKEMATLTSEGQQVAIDQLIKGIISLMTEAGVNNEALLGVGVGCPGAIDEKSGVVVFSPNLGWKGVPLKEIIEDSVHVPVQLENDANVAALAEHRFGAGRGSNHMVYITVSTGIGCGIIIDRRLYHGANNLAGELGHIIIEQDGPICNCGNNGCLEAMASGLAIERMAQEALAGGEETLIRDLVQGGRSPNAKVVSEAARRGDKIAREILARAGRYLGVGIASLVNLLNPEQIVTGGGLLKIGDTLLGPMREVVQQRVFCRSANTGEIIEAKLGDDVGLWGAIALILPDTLAEASTAQRRF